MTDYISAFYCQRVRTEVFIEQHNAQLPTTHCPSCRSSGHCPGLACSDCGYKHDIPWLILRGTEWGYDAVAITDRRQVWGRFNVPTEV